MNTTKYFMNATIILIISTIFLASIFSLYESLRIKNKSVKEREEKYMCLIIGFILLWLTGLFLCLIIDFGLPF